MEIAWFLVFLVEMQIICTVCNYYLYDIIIKLNSTYNLNFGDQTNLAGVHANVYKLYIHAYDFLASPDFCLSLTLHPNARVQKCWSQPKWVKREVTHT